MWGKGELDKKQGLEQGVMNNQNYVIYIPLWEMSTSSYERNFLRYFLKLYFFLFV